MLNTRHSRKSRWKNAPRARRRKPSRKVVPTEISEPEALARESPQTGTSVRTAPTARSATQVHERRPTGSTVYTYMSKDAQMKYYKYFPKDKYFFQNTRNAHPHAFSANARKLGEKMALNILEPHISGTHPLVDVGFGQRLRTGNHKKRVHGCECGDDPYTLHKLRLLELKDRNAKLEDQATHDGSRWTFCTCRAPDCTHCTPGAALFCHSIYYNTPQQVADILYWTRSRIGVSIHHHFRNSTGGFYMYDGRCESTYQVTCDKVKMCVAGNDLIYSHPNPSWLLSPQAFHPVTINGESWYLTFSHRNVDNQGDTVLATLALVKARDNVHELVHEERLKLADDDELVQTLRIKYQASNIFSDTTQICLTDDDQEIIIPRKYLSELRKWAAMRPYNNKTFASLVAEARRLIKPSNYLPLKVSVDSMAKVLPIIVIHVMKQSVEDLENVKGFFTHKNKFTLDQYNRYVLFDRWTGLNVLKILAAVIVTALVIYMAPWYELLGLALRVFWYSPIAYLNAAVCLSCSVILVYLVHSNWFTLTMFFTSVFCQGSPVSDSPVYIFVAVLAVILVWIVIKVAKRKSDPFTFWRCFKTSVEHDRRCISGEGAIPVTDPIRSMRSLIDLSKFQFAQDAKLKILEDKLSIDKRGPAVTPVGLVFTSAAPLVHSSCQLTLLQAMNCRVLIPLPEVTPLAIHSFQVVDEVMAPEYDLYNAGGYVESATGTIVTDVKTYDNHGKVSWDEYLARYPPAKRKILCRYREKVINGEIDAKRATYSCFVKREKIMAIGKDKFVPRKPRVIQGGPQKEKITSGPWFLNFSYALKHCLNLTNWIWYCAGATTDEYNWWFNHHTSRLGGFMRCVFSGTDFSTYDVTQGELAIKRECKYLVELGLLDDVIDAQEIIDGKLKSRVYGNGIKCEYEYRRKSGENLTSSGNSKCTADVIASFWLLESKEAKFEFNIRDHVAIAVIGDDNYTTATWTALSEIFGSIETFENKLQQHASSLGFKLKIQTSRNPTKVEFVSCRFYRVGHCFCIGKKPGRTLVKLGYLMHKANMKQERYEKLLLGVVISYLPTGLHVPFLRVYLEEVYDYLTAKHVKPEYDHKAVFRLRGTINDFRDGPVDSLFMNTYEIAGCSERSFRQLIVDALSKYGLPCIVDSPAVDRLLAVDTEL